eukprot:TRINITY_DN274_c3_g1_i1.p1 TRINITY_DN274_c3_g1~~TRINITY_DN274_c3_g1_i1.p1  ORF type:complete len:1116 (-),score=268.33 TRINITY_DN274_c3_g1_i1:68-3232(-)
MTEHTMAHYTVTTTRTGSDGKTTTSTSHYYPKAVVSTHNFDVDWEDMPLWGGHNPPKARIVSKARNTSQSSDSGVFSATSSAHPLASFASYDKDERLLELSPGIHRLTFKFVLPNDLRPTFYASFTQLNPHHKEYHMFKIRAKGKSLRDGKIRELPNPMSDELLVVGPCQVSYNYHHSLYNNSFMANPTIAGTIVASAGKVRYQFDNVPPFVEMGKPFTVDLTLTNLGRQTKKITSVEIYMKGRHTYRTCSYDAPVVHLLKTKIGDPLRGGEVRVANNVTIVVPIGIQPSCVVGMISFHYHLGLRWKASNYVMAKSGTAWATSMALEVRGPSSEPPNVMEGTHLLSEHVRLLRKPQVKEGAIYSPYRNKISNPIIPDYTIPQRTDFIKRDPPSFESAMGDVEFHLGWEIGMSESGDEIYINHLKRYCVQERPTEQVTSIRNTGDISSSSPAYPYLLSIGLPPGWLVLPYRNRPVYINVCGEGEPRSVHWRAPSEHSVPPPRESVIPGCAGTVMSQQSDLHLYMEIQVQRAEGLAPSNEDGSADPFACALSLEATSKSVDRAPRYQRVERKTNVIKKTVFPVWCNGGDDEYRSTLTVNVSGRRNVYLYLNSIEKKRMLDTTQSLGVVDIDVGEVMRHQTLHDGRFLEGWFTVTNGMDKSLLVAGKVKLRVGLFCGEVDLGPYQRNPVRLDDVYCSPLDGWWPTPQEVEAKAKRKIKKIHSRLEKVNSLIELNVAKKGGPASESHLSSPLRSNSVPISGPTGFRHVNRVGDRDEQDETDGSMSGRAHFTRDSKRSMLMSTRELNWTVATPGTKVEDVDDDDNEEDEDYEDDDEDDDDEDECLSVGARAMVMASTAARNKMEEVAAEATEQHEYEFDYQEGDDLPGVAEQDQEMMAHLLDFLPPDVRNDSAYLAEAGVLPEGLHGGCPSSRSSATTTTTTTTSSSTATTTSSSSSSSNSSSTTSTSTSSTTPTSVSVSASPSTSTSSSASPWSATTTSSSSSLGLGEDASEMDRWKREKSELQQLLSDMEGRLESVLSISQSTNLFAVNKDALKLKR